jgi:hypothetical protein
MPKYPTEILMRIPALAMLTIVTGMLAVPARAQTYDPRYPVCLQTYGIDGGYIECAYDSLAQCAMSASARAAQCVVNPFFAGGQMPARPSYRSRRAY